MNKTIHKIPLKNKQELDLMRKSGLISAQALKETLMHAKNGVTLMELEKIAAAKIQSQGAKPAFKTVDNYPYATCLTLNDELVHGLPREIILKTGDLLSIDLGAMYQGFCTDVAWSILIGGGENYFLNIGERALWQAIDQAVVGNRVGDISLAIQTVVERAGFSVTRSLIGHGVGKKLHEPPEIPGFGVAGSGPLLCEGMTLAIEVIYTGGKPDVVVAPDNWTIKTADQSLGGLFEMTVIVGKVPEVITDWRV